LNGRQVTDLITLSGAAVQTRSSNPQVTFQGGNYLAIAGGVDFGVPYSLDGAMHNNVYDGTQMPLPFPDALQEFKVVASGTTAMLADDFRTFASPACNAGRQINLSAPFSGNQINPALYSPVALYIAARLPKPQDDCGKIVYGADYKRNEIQAVGKADYQLSAN